MNHQHLRRSWDIQIVSDLHLETPLLRPRYECFELPVAAPYLALLGDIGKVNQPGLFTFLKRQLQKYTIVFYLLGNHEAYREQHEYSSYTRATELVRAFEKEVNTTESKADGRCGQFVFLERTRFDIPNSHVSILGCTLFSHVPPEQEESVTLKVSDFSAFGPGSGHIDDWDVQSHNQAHLKNLKWLNDSVLEIEQECPPRSVIIFSHHSPTRLQEANDPRHLEDRSQVSSAFVTDLSKELCWQSPIVVAWAFGHTHFNCDFIHLRPSHLSHNKSSHLRIFTNQLGYSRADESPGFDVTKTITVGTNSPQQDCSKSNANLIITGKDCNGGGGNDERPSTTLHHRLGVFWCFN